MEREKEAAMFVKLKCNFQFESVSPINSEWNLHTYRSFNTYKYYEY